MKQNILYAIILLIPTAILLSGCNDKPSRPQSMVIDIRTVLDATGDHEQIEERTETMKQQIFDEIEALSDKLSKEIEEKRANFSDALSGEEKQEIQNLQGQLRLQIIQARKKGNERYAKEVNEIRQYYLDGIMSVAQTVALEYGTSIIIKANAGLFWFDESVDITDEVVRRMMVNKDTQPADGEKN